nr:hypothetical protein [Escherichia coli]
MQYPASPDRYICCVASQVSLVMDWMDYQQVRYQNAMRRILGWQ